MKKEIIVSAILFEDETGGFRAFCPDLDISVRGKDETEALAALKKELDAHIAKTGFSNLQLNAVRCTKMTLTMHV
ncbi:MAG: hypothetical protein HY880_09420 [Deltaproteobacteria bacterium]|nr:hypothetical protein [Deltaproteobacteria bacterium]